eukprot:m.42483 g.42483  ORF g.42483 m.42483 type:complete len:74 (+) comp15030_c0_seq4:133-354(+)
MQYYVMQQDGKMAPVTPPSWYGNTTPQTSVATCQMASSATPVSYAVTPCHAAVSVTHQQIHAVRPVSVPTNWS